MVVLLLALAYGLRKKPKRLALCEIVCKLACQVLRGRSIEELIRDRVQIEQALFDTIDADGIRCYTVRFRSAANADVPGPDCLEINLSVGRTVYIEGHGRFRGNYQVLTSTIFVS